MTELSGGPGATRDAAAAAAAHLVASPNPARLAITARRFRRVSSNTTFDDESSLIEQDGPTTDLTRGIRYPGGKNAPAVWTWLLGLMPEHAYYAEPFVGSGALLRRKPPAMRSVIVDRDERVIRWWRDLATPGVDVVAGCGIEWLKREGPALTADWLVYLDPPYLLSTRTKKVIYRHELSDADHQRLLEAATSTPARVMLSGYESPAYSSHLASWYRGEQQAMSRGGVRTEVVWCNFDPLEAPAAALPVPGRDFRERERIKRKVARWRANFAAMPGYERRAVLRELLRAEQQSIDPRHGRR